MSSPNAHPFLQPPDAALKVVHDTWQTILTDTPIEQQRDAWFMLYHMLCAYQLMFDYMNLEHVRSDMETLAGVARLRSLDRPDKPVVPEPKLILPGLMH